MTKIGILHPGEMGVAVATSAINSGHEVYWASQGRSDKTSLRADKYALTDASSLSQLCQISDVIISVCPPHAAEEVAMSVLEQGFKGYYLEANAISPMRRSNSDSEWRHMVSVSSTGESSADLHGVIGQPLQVFQTATGWEGPNELLLTAARR